MAIYTAAGFETQQDTRFADNSNGDIDEADYRNAFEDVADSCAFTADVNTFSENNIFGEIDHVQVFGATSIDAYSNTGEVQPTVHVYCDDGYAIAIENTDNVDADTKRWVFGQEDDGDLVGHRISESGGTDTANEWLNVDQNSDIIKLGRDAVSFTPTVEFGGASTGVTYTSQSGLRKVIGDLVFIQIEINLSSKGSSTGAATISGLPYNTDSGVNSSFIVSRYTNFNSGVTGVILATAGSSSASIALRIPNGSGGTNTMADTDFTNSSRLFISGFYFR